MAVAPLFHCITDDAEDFGSLCAIPGGRRISQQSREERWGFLVVLCHSIFTRPGNETMSINAVIRALKHGTILKSFTVNLRARLRSEM
jgi:hypothetical protein